MFEFSLSRIDLVVSLECINTVLEMSLNEKKLYDENVVNQLKDTANTLKKIINIGDNLLN